MISTKCPNFRVVLKHTVLEKCDTQPRPFSSIGGIDRPQLKSCDTSLADWIESSERDPRRSGAKNLAEQCWN